MYKASFILIAKILVTFAVYYLLDYLFGFVITLIIIIILLIMIIIYGLKKDSDISPYIEVACNTDRYLYEINKKYQNKDVSLLNFYRAYAEIFTGNFENVNLALSEIDYDNLKNKEKLMFHEISLKTAFYNKDKDLYIRLLNEIIDEGVPFEFPNEIEVFKIPILVMNEEYEEIIEKLFELIPVQRKRLRIFELEYYLAISYIKTGKIEDAIAILEFIIGKDLKFIYTEKAKELLEETQQS